MLKVSLDNLRSWTRYNKGMCQDCLAWCCYLPVEVDVADLVRMGLIDEFEATLGNKHILKKLQGKEIKRWDAKSEKFILVQMADGACPYLDANKQCTIYDKRPNTCREHPGKGPRPGFCPYQKKSKK